MPFITDDFMITSKTGSRLYHDYAEELPIIDYHCHLSPKMIAEDYRFRDAYDLFLGGDHYKWRQMRTNGIPEEFITGDAPEKEKFLLWAKTCARLIGNPLLHWNQLELCRYFGINELLSEKNAEAAWETVNACLASPDFSARALIKKSNVKVVCTTDDPTDDLRYHKEIAALSDFSTKVLPTFRPDAAVEITKDTFPSYMAACGVSDFAGLLSYLSARVLYFYENGCRLSDHGVDYVPYAEGDAEAVFNKRMRGEAITEEERDIYRTAVMLHCARLYAKYGFTMQLHMGPMRNNNTRMFRALGADAGFDSIGDAPVAFTLSRFLDALDTDGCLPKTILYTLNPKDNYVLGTMLGNFQGDGIPGKMQFGSGWWFNDQRDGMVTQMTTLANLGMLSRFVGMLTDSRSFVSYPRHEYFRRIFCNLIGTWVDNGEYPLDEALLREITEGVAFRNADSYFGF